MGGDDDDGEVVVPRRDRTVATAASTTSSMLRLGCGRPSAADAAVLFPAFPPGPVLPVVVEEDVRILRAASRIAKAMSAPSFLGRDSKITR